MKGMKAHVYLDRVAPKKTPHRLPKQPNVHSEETSVDTPHEQHSSKPGRKLEKSEEEREAARSALHTLNVLSFLFPDCFQLVLLLLLLRES